VAHLGRGREERVPAANAGTGMPAQHCRSASRVREIVSLSYDARFPMFARRSISLRETRYQRGAHSNRNS